MDGKVNLPPHGKDFFLRTVSRFSAGGKHFFLVVSLHKEEHLQIPYTVPTVYGRRIKDGIDASGNLYQITEEMPYYRELLNYKYMEYNNLKKGEDYRADLFSVPQ